MGTELRITFDGTTPGLGEHRLSLSAFGTPLQLLLTALQRTATSIITDAADPEYGERGGRFARQAELLDLELASIAPGCATPSFVCSLRPDERHPQRALFVDDLPERALVRLVSDLGTEGKGARANAGVRKYLASLPDGVTHQRYAAVRDGVEIAVAEFGLAVIADAPQALARLVQIVGRVIAVGFEPFSVTLKGSRQVKCEATSELVDQAVSLRSEEVRGAILEARTARLLWLRAAANEPAPLSESSTVSHLAERWDGTMRELAK